MKYSAAKKEKTKQNKKTSKKTPLSHNRWEGDEFCDNSKKISRKENTFVNMF